MFATDALHNSHTSARELVSKHFFKNTNMSSFNIKSKPHKLKPKLDDKFDYGLKFSWAVYSGFIMIVLGMALVVIAELSRIPNTFLYKLLSNVPAVILTVLSHIGTGLIASSILVFTLERANTKRHIRDVEELKIAHSESILKELMPVTILNEIKTHIIQQPFIRRNCQGTLLLSWIDESKEYLLLSDNFLYEIENTSKTNETYLLNFFEEKLYADKFPDYPVIRNIKLEGNNPEYFNYEDNKLKKLQITTKQYIEVQITRRLKPGEKMKVSYSIESIKFNRDFHYYVMSKPSIDLRLAVIHPDDIEVHKIPLHPSSNAFINETENSGLKIWRIDAGILPFQGIEISWLKKQ